MHKALPCHPPCERMHRYGHDGQRKRVAHMPTATTTEATSRFTIGLKAPTRLRDEADFGFPLIATTFAPMANAAAAVGRAARCSTFDDSFMPVHFLRSER